VVQPSALRFTLSFIDGCGVLQLEDRALGTAGRADRLALDVPGLRFPFDLSGGLNSFQNRLTRLRELMLSVSCVELGKTFGRAPLAGYGLFDPVVEFRADGLRLAARAEVGGRAAEVSMRAQVVPAGPVSLRLVVDHVHVYGFLPVPAPALVLALFRALGAEDPGGGAEARGGWSAAFLRASGSAVLELQALDLSLFPLMAAQGWRLPDQNDVRLSALALDGTQLQLRFSREQAVEGIVPSGPLDPRFADAEWALAEADYPFALAAYRRAHEEEPADAFAAERLLQLLAASPDDLPELEQRTQALAQQAPDHPGALLARALLAAERGRPSEAAAPYLRLAELAEESGETLEAACARAAAAEQLRRAGRGAAATSVLERARELRPDHVGVLRALRQRYWTEERWEDLLALLWQQAEVETRPELRARALSEGGLVLLLHRRRPQAARERFEQALQLQPEDPGAWEGLALLARTQDPAEAIRLLERAGRGYEARGLVPGQARVEVARGMLLQEAGDSEGALARFRRAAEIDRSSPEPLCRAAALLGTLGRMGEAVDLLERATPQLPEPQARLRVLRQLAALERDVRRDPVATRQRLEEALQLRPADPAALEELARALDAAGEPQRVEPFLRRAVVAAQGASERATVGLLCQRFGRELPAPGLLAEGLAMLASPGDADGARHALELADLAEKLGNADLLARAADTIEQVLVAEGDNPQPVARLASRLASLRLRMGDREASEKLSRQALESHPDADTAAAAWKTIVKCALDRGDAVAVRAGLAGWAEDARVSDEPAARAARLAEAGELERQRLGSFATAHPLFERALALDPGNRVALQGLAGAAERARQWPRLEELLRRLLGVEPPPARAIRHRLAEVILRRGGRMDEAMRLYEGLQEQDPADARAAVGLGRALWTSGRLEDSLAQYEKIVTVHERGSADPAVAVWAAEAHLRLAQSARLLGEVGNAHRHLQEAQTGEPERGAPAEVLVEVLEAFGQTDQLVGVLERRRACAPTPAVAAETAHALGGVLERIGRADEAVAVYRSLLAVAPDDVAARLRLAEIFRRESRRDELVETLERLLDLAIEPGAAAADGLDAEALGLELHGLYGETGAASDRIEAVLRKVLGVRPHAAEVSLALFELLQAQPTRAPEAFATLALLYRQTGLPERSADLGRALGTLAENAAVDPALAISILEDAAGADPRDTPLVEALLNLYDRLPDRAQTAERMRGLLERVPALDGAPRIRVHLTLAGAAEERGDLAAAEDELGRAMGVDTDPATRAAQLVARARVRILRGRVAEGQEDLQAALRVVPGHPEALLQLADLAESERRWPDALELLDRLAAEAGAPVLIPADRLAFRRASAALKAGHPARAVAGLEEVLTIDPDDLPAREMLVEVHLRGEDPQAARPHLEHLTSAHPDGASYWASLSDVLERLGQHRDAADAVGGLARALSEPRPRAEALVRRGDILRERLDEAPAALYAYRLAQDADPTYIRAALRVIETRWQAGDLTPDGLANRMVEVAIHCTDDTAALDEALAFLALTDDGTLLPALRQALDAHPATDPATQALRARLADRTPA
jgi:tetratricopeptide (TPR) repeat protein